MTDQPDPPPSPEAIANARAVVDVLRVMCDPGIKMKPPEIAPCDMEPMHE